MPTNRNRAEYPSLQDKVVLITGGASGIGAVMVEYFSVQGSKVAFLDVDAACATELINQIGDAKYTPSFVHCDLTDVTAIRESVAQITAELGPVRVLVNNAANDDR